MNMFFNILSFDSARNSMSVSFIIDTIVNTFQHANAAIDNTAFDIKIFANHNRHTDDQKKLAHSLIYFTSI
jgi:hypothetical protein